MKKNNTLAPENRTNKKPRFAVFDIDGTLIRWQLYHAVVDRLAKYNLLGEKAHEEIRAARMRWKRREGENPYKIYEESLVSEYESSLNNITVKDFDRVADEVFNEYQHQVYTYTRELIHTLKQQDYFLIAISGSHEKLIERIANVYGFDDFAGSQYESKNGVFTGKRFIANKNKASVLKGLIVKHGLSLTDSLAIGDSKSDAPILEMVEHPIAFNPDRELLRIAKEKGWDIVVERKNVIYELSHSENGYTLQP